MTDLFDSMFMGEAVESDLARALRTNDKKYIDNYTKQFENKRENDLFLILDNITVKRNMEFDVSSVKYNKYIIDDMLSRSNDCLGHVFLMNLIGEGLTDQQHYDYLVRTCPVGRKNYADGTKVYLREDAHESLVKIILCHVYQCNMDVAKDYLDVLVARDKVEEFTHRYRAYLLTDDCNDMVKKYIRHKESKKEYEMLVEEIMEK